MQYTVIAKPASDFRPAAGSNRSAGVSLTPSGKTRLAATPGPSPAAASPDTALNPSPLSWIPGQKCRQSILHRETGGIVTAELSRLQRPGL